ncbi:MAG TPA: hypothetical protein VN228_04230 [Pyrinomonadaceae bacterium]|nr:hypothetical protein [Pyrinomonadaceae bacterium]
MSWNNAPRLNKLTASQQGGSRGAQLWGVDIKGKLYTCYQYSPGGSWSGWAGEGWSDPNEPKGVYELAASQTGDGTVLFWALDLRYHLWARQQTSAGGNWGPWRKDFQAPPGQTKLRKIAASAAGGGQGSHLFGITDNGLLTHVNSSAPGIAWGAWADFPATPEKSRFIEVTACRQGDHRAAVWALDEKRQLWGAGQETVGGKWGPWVGPNWLGAPKLRNIAAVEGMNGAIIVGQDEDYEVTSNFQQGPGSNSWRGWSTPQGFDPRSYELTAAGQNNRVAQLWAITLGGKLTTVTQKENNHWNPDWSDKDDDSSLPTPPEKPQPRPPKPSHR